MTLPRPTIVIFDMDGTIVRHIDPRVLHVLEWLDDRAYTVSRIVEWVFRRGLKGPMLPTPEELAQRKPPRLLVHRAIHKFRRKSVEQIVEPCPGVRGVLSYLQDQSVPMALVSNGMGKGYGHEILEKFSFESYFTTTIFREDIKKSKPNPESLILAMQALQRPANENDVVWYIGDRHKDVKAALAAGKHGPAHFVPIACGLNAAVAILENGLSTDHILMSWWDIHRRLKKSLQPV